MPNPTATHSPAEVIANLIVQLGLGTDPSSWQTGAGGTWPVFIAGEPALPEEVITVYDTQWRQDGRSMPDGETWNHYGVQVRIRASDHLTGWQKAVSIQKALDEQVQMTQVTISGHRYDVWSLSNTNVLSIGKDTPTGKRSVFTMNPVAAIVVQS